MAEIELTTFVIALMGNLHNKLTFDLGKKNKIFYYSYRKRILRLVELQSLLERCCKIRKFANFVYIIVLRAEKVTIFAAISAQK